MIAAFLLLIVCATQGVPKNSADWVRDLGSEKLEERQRADSELRRLGVGAEAALREGARSADPEVRGRCARLLAWIGLRKQLPADWGYDHSPVQIVDWCLDANPELRLKGLRTINMAGDVRALPVLRRFVDDPHPSLRRAVLERMASYGDKTSTSLVGRLLDDPDPVVQADALALLARWKDVSHDRRVRAFLDSPVADLRAAAFLAFRASEADVPRIRQAALKDPSDRVRLAVLQRIEETGDRRHGPLVLQIIAERSLPRSSVQLAGRWGLVPSEAEIVKTLDRPFTPQLDGEGPLFDLYPKVEDPALKERLQGLLLAEINDHTRLAVARLLDRSGIRKLPPAVREALRSKDPALRLRAVEAAEGFPEDALTADLIDLLKTAEVESELRELATVLASRPDGRSAWDVLEKRARQPGYRHPYLKALCRLDGPRGAQVCLEVLPDLGVTDTYDGLVRAMIVEYGGGVVRESALKALRDGKGRPDFTFVSAYLKHRPTLTPAEVEAFTALLRDEEYWPLGVKLLARCGAREAVPSLLKLLSDPVRTLDVAAALYDVGTPAEAAVVAGFLSSDDPDVLGTALLGLSRFGGKEHIPAIARHLSNERLFRNIPYADFFTPHLGKSLVLETAVEALEKITDERLAGVNAMDTARLWRERLSR